MSNITNIKAWPFLIGKNRQFGYRIVVAPDFLVAAHIPGCLDKLRSNQIIEKPVTEVLETKEVGDITALYRVVYIPNSGKMYTDLQNRPILWTEGVVIRGRFSDMVIPESIFQVIHKEIEHFADTFYQSEDKPDMVIGKSLEIELSGKDIQNPEATRKRLQKEIYKLKDQERQIQAQIDQIDHKMSQGKNIALIGVPLVLIAVGVVVIPVGLWMYYDGTNKRRDPEAMIKTLREQIKMLEDQIALLN